MGLTLCRREKFLALPHVSDHMIGFTAKFMQELQYPSSDTNPEAGKQVKDWLDERLERGAVQLKTITLLKRRCN
jgi:hypothetical protein